MLKIVDSSKEKDTEAAKQFFLQAISNNNADACLQLGILFATAVEPDYIQAAKWYEEAGRKGIAEGFYNLAFLYFKGLGVAKNTTTALELLEEAFNMGCASAANMLFEYFVKEITVQNHLQIAYQWLQKAADLGDIQATIKLAECFDKGLITNLTSEYIVRLLEMAADNGYVEAKEVLGLWFYQGKPVNQDHKIATKWFYRAAKEGSRFAQAWLGDQFSEGKLFKRNLSVSAMWYENAAKNRHIGALQALTAIFMASSPNENDMKRLFNYWLIEAESGNVLAQRVIGGFYLEGKGTTSSLSEAVYWLEAASNQGHSTAKLMLASLKTDGAF